MNPVLTYTIQSSTVLSLFFLFYFLVLRKETYYSINRVYILVSGALSLLIPLVRFNIPVNNQVAYFYMLPQITLSAKAETYKSSNVVNYYDVLLYVYFAGVLFVSLKLIASVISIYLISNKCKQKTVANASVFVYNKLNSPFSFFKMIFVSEQMLASNGIENILLHEKEHIRKKHSLDILFFSILKIIQWYNPLIYLFKKELEAQHEFIADDELISSGINADKYKQILFAYSVYPGINNITNNFNSLIKRRFEMINIPKSSLTARLKILPVFPLVLFTVFYFGIANGNSLIAGEKSQKANPAVSAIKVQSSKTTAATSAKPKAHFSDPDIVYEKADKMPTLKGGNEALFKFLAENIVYPAAAKEANIQGRVLVNFVITKTGDMTDIKIQEGIGYGCDEEVIRMLKTMPKWIPGEKDKNKVSVKVTLPVTFKLQ